MFGYVVCNKEKLSQEETDRYQSVYCGLCKTLEKKFGQMSRMSLNYDMTFLVLFLSSLYEPEEESYEFRCSLHPMRPKKAAVNKYTDYAADMTIALTYYKCLDDWEDERKKPQYYFARKLQPAYQEVKKRYPRQCGAIETEIGRLSEIEKSPDSIPDDALNCFGRLMAEVFVYEEDFWSEKLWNFGCDLGKFIYLMDAVLDYKKDIKKNNYNPLLRMNKVPEEMEELLTLMIGNAARRFEGLPMIQDVNILRNIIYGGVWQQYYAWKNGNAKSSPDAGKHGQEYGNPTRGSHDAQKHGQEYGKERQK